MLYEDLRLIHEDVERLESAIAERYLENPKQNKRRLARDHEIAHFAGRIRDQSERAVRIYKAQKDERMQEVQSISTGDALESFYKQLSNIKEFHSRNSNETIENLETAYKKQPGARVRQGVNIDSMFTGEEEYGQFLDLVLLHEEYLNLPGVKGVRRLTYLQYLDNFDQFTPPKCTISKQNKVANEYFSYVTSLAQYLENFLRKSKPLEELDGVLRGFDTEFEKEWDAGKVEGWEKAAPAGDGLQTQGTGEGVWCAACEKEFKNDSNYKAHLTGKKHIRNAEAKKDAANGTANGTANGHANGMHVNVNRLKEKATAEREFRIRKLAAMMQTIRAATRTEVERRSLLTDREREQEKRAKAIDDSESEVEEDDAEEDAEDEEEKFYNPLKLPLAWDGKPIPFWLYKLHGLGSEYPCEICGNFVYMGRRNFDKHFSEARHITGLKCLGITSTSLFREITQIKDAEMLRDKLQQDKRLKSKTEGDIIEMEDSKGVVLPLSIYNDLLADGEL